MRDLLSVFTELIPNLIAAVVSAMRFWIVEITWGFCHGDGLFRLGRGMKITVMTTRPRPAVQRVRASFLLAGSIYTSGWVDVQLADEGITWCRGWEGEKVEALLVAQALA